MGMNTQSQPAEPLAPLAPLDAVYLLKTTMESNQAMLRDLVSSVGVQIPMLAAHIATQQIEQYDKLIGTMRRMIADMEGEDAETL